MKKPWLYYFVWFIWTSRTFLNKSLLGVIQEDGIKKGIAFASEMREWDKLTSEQREAWYCSGEGRTIEF